MDPVPLPKFSFDKVDDFKEMVSDLEKIPLLQQEMLNHFPKRHSNVTRVYIKNNNQSVHGPVVNHNFTIKKKDS